MANVEGGLRRRAGRGLGDAEKHGAADHLARDPVRGQPLVVLRRDDPTLPHDGDTIGGVEHFPKLVCDEDDGSAARGQRSHRPEQFTRFLRREHRRRFVQDENLGLSEQCLEDLDALSEAHREAADDRVGVEIDPETPAEFGRLPLRGLAVEPVEGQDRLRAQNDVLRDRERRRELEVLVDHADPGRDGLGRSGESDRGAAHQHLAGGARQKAIENVHEGRLAGPVLPDEGVDLTGPDSERRIVDCDEVSEMLDDGAHRDELARLCHRRDLAE